MSAFINPSWSITKFPNFSTIAQETAKFQGSVYVSETPFCKWEFELTLPYIAGSLNDPTSDLGQLVGLFMSCKGRAGTFLYDDPSDDSVSQVGFAIGNGTTTQFQLTRPIAAGVDLIQNLNGAPVIFSNGSIVSNYTIDDKGVVTFTAAPANGAVLTWSGNFYFLCRFKSDTLDQLKEHYTNQWDCQLTFESVIR